MAFPFKSLVFVFHTLVSLFCLCTFFLFASFHLSSENYLCIHYKTFQRLNILFKNCFILYNKQHWFSLPMTAAIFPFLFASLSRFPRKSKEHSFLDTLQSSLSHVSSSPLLGPCLLIKICNWIKQVYVSTSCFLCNLCPTPHNSKQKKKKGNVFPFTEKNQLSSLLKWNHMYLFLGKSSKKPEGSL